MIFRILFLSVFCASFAVAAPVYKWVDDTGNIHFSDKPPPEKVEAQELAQEPAPDEHETQESQQKLVMIKERFKRDQERRLAAREEKRQQKESEQALQANRTRRCRDAQYQLHQLERQAPMYYISEQGKRVFLEDEERGEYIGRYRSEVSTFCD